MTRQNIDTLNRRLKHYGASPMPTATTAENTINFITTKSGRHSELTPAERTELLRVAQNTWNLKRVTKVLDKRSMGTIQYISPKGNGSLDSLRQPTSDKSEIKTTPFMAYVAWDTGNKTNIALEFLTLAE